MEMINGYQCKTCTDVEFAKKNIDPAHPKDGPFGVNAKEQVAQRAAEPAVRFGGSLEGLSTAPALNGEPVRPSLGAQLDLRI